MLGWYDRHRRDLPFRGVHDPYLVLVSEAMAQQTQIGRVAEAWQAFVARYPTVEALAAAPLADVLRAWAGLGYNRRAVHLHRAAQAIVRDHGGVVPAELDALRRLPGVGPYTARAVAAIAFGRRVGAVDTNVRRVLSRLSGAADAGSIRDARLQALADDVVPASRSADWTAALMDVGATHCRPTPRCDGCPARRWCPVGHGATPDTGATRQTRRRSAGTSPSFEMSTRWLRGRIVARLRDAPAGAWVTIDTSIGAHPVTAVVRALHALERDGIAELDRAEPTRARLAGG